MYYVTLSTTTITLCYFRQTQQHPRPLPPCNVQYYIIYIKAIVYRVNKIHTGHVSSHSQADKIRFESEKDRLEHLKAKDN